MSCIAGITLAAKRNADVLEIGRFVMECVGPYPVFQMPSVDSRSPRTSPMDQILVVDDDPNIRELLRDYLQGMG
jgi:hypothetical protein